ncbi:probable G-protein coupled receptor Mth-like 3 [Anabrus simplex]|uniref:probable G-protein coupled receptor Mth-like 3 n=1 Tax=Anabrus simplex TaxID=316456 RepID=UPI0035A2D2CE
MPPNVFWLQVVWKQLKVVKYSDVLEPNAHSDEDVVIVERSIKTIDEDNGPLNTSNDIKPLDSYSRDEMRKTRSRCDCEKHSPRLHLCQALVIYSGLLQQVLPDVVCTEMTLNRYLLTASASSNKLEDINEGLPPYAQRLFSDLRSLSGTTLMNLLAALFMAQLLYVIGVGGVEDRELCVALGFSLQYIRLTVFCWLTAMTHDMYTTFRENVNLIPVADPKIGSSFCKYSLFAWGSPLVLLAAAVVLQLRQKGGRLLDTASLARTNCWFLDHDAYMYAFILPVLCLLLFDVVYLAKSAVVIRYTVSMQVDKRVRDKMRRKRRLQLCLFVKVTLLIGGVAALGALAKLTSLNAFWVAFNIGHGLQGIAVALCVTCNCQVLKIYTRSLRRRRCAQYGSAGGVKQCSDLSKSTSLQLLTWEPAPDAV